MDGYPLLWILKFLGRLHPLVVHFPIGLLVAGLFLELLTINGKRPGLREGIVWLVYLGMCGAIVAAVLGFLLYRAEDYQGEVVESHLILGFLTVVMGLLTVWLLRKSQKSGFQNLLYYRILFAATVACLTLAGHMGASLTHGEDFLSSTLPWHNNSYEEGKADELLAELSPVAHSETLTIEQLDKLNLEVRAIFAHNCYQCHSEEKQKAALRLDSEDGVMKGGESGKILVAGDAASSEIIRRLKLPRSDEEAMPGKGKALSAAEIALISLWIDQGAHWADAELKVFPEAPLALSRPDLPQKEQGLTHPVDRLINAYFEEKEVAWPEVVDDQTFMRRAYLDIVGLLPTPEQVKAFEKDPSDNKRNKLIKILLNDSVNYTQHWLSFWNDLLRNDYSGTGFITGGREQITDWLYHSLLSNKPYHQMVKELTNPDEKSAGFIKGIQWRGVVNASQRVEMQAAQNISQSLLGVNLKCASCHNSFVSNLTLAQAYGFASVFSDTTLELYRCDVPTGKMSKVSFLYPELGAVEAETVKEKLRLLSEVMVKPENGRLYRTIVNRMWHRLMGRGIVEPLDEMDNTPWSAALLDWLAADFIDKGYDLKYMLEMIMTSRTYQLASVEFDKVEELKSDRYVFTGPVRRRLSAEQFADAVSQVITPLYYTMAYDPKPEPMEAAWIWFRDSEADRDILPRPGKRYFRYSFAVPSGKKIEQAEAIISVDHAFQLYLNGQSVAEGSNWRQVEHVAVSEWLQAGSNQIALEGENEGSVPNPAGLLFALQIMYEDGTEDHIFSHEDWKAMDQKPEDNWILPDFDDHHWPKVKQDKAKLENSHWGKLVNFSFSQYSKDTFVRASLVKLDPFLKALGRPTRENVTTSREDQATLLQALELTNGEFFNKAMEEGAEAWLAQYGGNSNELVNQLYLKAFSRQPNAEEKALIIRALGEKPTKEAVQDLLWATVLLPEFQFIY